MAKTKNTESAQTETSKSEASKLTPVKKITVATVYGPISMKDLPPLFTGSIENPIPNPNRELKLCRIAGFASGVKHGESTYGPWAAVQGDFAATNYGTGEIFAGKTALIPGAMGEALVTATEQGLSEDAESKVRFSVDISVHRSPREPDKKYVYVVRPVLEAALSSPAMALLGMSE